MPIQSPVFLLPEQVSSQVAKLEVTTQSIMSLSNDHNDHIKNMAVLLTDLNIFLSKLFH